MDDNGALPLRQRSCVRPARAAEVAALRALVAAVDASTPYLPREPGEWPAWCDGPDPAESLACFQARPNGCVLVAVEGGTLIGWLGATGGQQPVTRGSVTVALGVAADRRGHGIGTALLTTARRWAEGAGVRRLDLTVVADNRAAAALYRRLGYEDEGTLRRSARVNGAWQDEHVLALLLDTAGPRCPPLSPPPRPGPLAAARQAIIRPARDGIFHAEAGGMVLGTAILTRNTLARERHDAGLRLNVRRDAGGHGLGRRLLAAAEGWARDNGLERLTARILAHDPHARRFAATAGFAEEVLCRSALMLDGCVADAVVLGRLL